MGWWNDAVNTLGNLDIGETVEAVETLTGWDVPDFGGLPGTPDGPLGGNRPNGSPFGLNQTANGNGKGSFPALATSSGTDTAPTPEATSWTKYAVPAALAVVGFVLFRKVF